MVVWGSHFRSLAGTLALLWSAAPTILCRLSSMEKVSIWFTAFRRTQGCPTQTMQALIKADVLDGQALFVLSSMMPTSDEQQQLCWS